MITLDCRSALWRLLMAQHLINMLHASCTAAFSSPSRHDRRQVIVRTSFLSYFENDMKTTDSFWISGLETGVILQVFVICLFAKKSRYACNSDGFQLMKFEIYYDEFI